MKLLSLSIALVALFATGSVHAAVPAHVAAAAKAHTVAAKVVRVGVTSQAATRAKAASCCAGGDCCSGGNCCAMPGCCPGNGECCAPDTGACTSACGCPAMNCCR